MVYQHYDDIDIKKLQIIFLKQIMHENWKTISEITGYAPNSCKAYYGRYKHLATEAYNKFGQTQKLFPHLEQDPNKSYTYHIIIRNPDGSIKYRKVGKANNTDNRFETLVRENCPCYIELIDRYELSNEDASLTFENFLRNYLVNNYKGTHKPHDRFVPSSEWEDSCFFIPEEIIDEGMRATELLFNLTTKRKRF
jgi:hypothetical protein